jgi:hypothetical protein
MAASSSTRLWLAHQGDREIGSRASPDFGVRATAREPATKCPSKKIFLVLVLQNKKCVLARRTPDLPVNLAGPRHVRSGRKQPETRP